MNDPHALDGSANDGCSDASNDRLSLREFRHFLRVSDSPEFHGRPG